MDLQLAGKHVLITGASGGIGRALAEVFAAEGAQLALLGGRRTPELAAFVAGRPWHERALCLACDLTRPEEVATAFGAARARFGPLQVCVANAGAWPRPEELLHQASVERIRATLDANLFSVLWTARAFLADLALTPPPREGGSLPRHGAALTFIGSTAGIFGERHHADYAAAKAGLAGLVHSLKNEIVLLDPYGRVNLVAPGWTATHIARPELEQAGTIRRITRTMPLRQLARALDIARAVAVLSSPAVSRHVSGQTITVAGGMEGRALWAESDVDEDSVRGRLRDAD
ncbi:MAG: SDR family oxidoreductase [Planctomycetes bacterium]|nr:SDR family oxidoreductase [Planctomycetota bacterium]